MHALHANDIFSLLDKVQRALTETIVPKRLKVTERVQGSILTDSNTVKKLGRLLQYVI